MKNKKKSCLKCQIKIKITKFPSKVYYIIFFSNLLLKKNNIKIKEFMNGVYE